MLRQPQKLEVPQHRAAEQVVVEAGEYIADCLKGLADGLYSLAEKAVSKKGGFPLQENASFRRIMGQRGGISVETIIAVIIAVLGWIVGYGLNLNAQRKAFLDQIINNARIEINESLRDYQTWLIDIKDITSDIWSYIYSISSTVNDSNQRQDKFQQIMAKREAVRWITILEEYEVLFPETRTVRIELLERHNEISKSLISHAGSPNCALDKEFIYDQIALIEDLRIYFQNKCLGQLTGNKIPERLVIDKTLPCIRLVNGQLSIIKASSVQDNNST